MINHSSIASVEALYNHDISISSLDVHLSTGAASAIHRVAVGVFGRDGRTKRVKTFASHGVFHHGVRLSLPCPLSGDDHVLVACNAPEDLFEGYIPDETTFRSREMTVDDALDNFSSTGTVASLPMFGEAGWLAMDKSAHGSAEVRLLPMFSKITLDRFEIDMQSIDGHFGKELFAPDRLMLANVPERLTFGGASDHRRLGHGDMLNYSKLGFHGHMCLGTSGISDVMGRRYFSGLPLYVPASDCNDADRPLLLVVKGLFSPYGPGQMRIPVSFPLPVGSIKAGKHYHVCAKVSDIGSGVSYDTNGNPRYMPLDTVNNTVTVKTTDFD